MNSEYLKYSLWGTSSNTAQKSTVIAEKPLFT